MSAKSSFLTYAMRPAGLVAVALLVAACGPEQEGPGGQQQPPSPVSVSAVSEQNVTYYGEYGARVRGAREVDVRAQVSGILQERRFAEGDYVEAGQTLFQIDPEPYQLALDSAQAELADARSARQQAESEFNRVSGLHQNNAASARELEQAQANRDAARARVARAEASLSDAQRNLRYTRVEAPVGGMAGAEMVSEGNLIEPGAMLTQVTQTDPVRVHFALPENDALQRRGQPQSEAYTQAWLELPGGSTYEHAGEITYTGNRIDIASASLPMHATFANPEGVLLPGQFARVRVVLEEFENVVLINPTAVSQGPQGTRVFVLTEGSTVTARPVQLGPVIDGQQVVLDGISEGDEIVTNGHVALFEGATVTVTNRTGEEG